MGNSQSQALHAAHEVATAVNLALALTAIGFGLAGPYHPAAEAFRAMDLAISRNLGILPPQSHFTEGYFAFFVPACVLAVCVWLLLRLTSRARLTRAFLRSGSGVVAPVAAPAWWLVLYYKADEWSLFTVIQSVVVLLILLYGIWYVSAERTVPGRGVAVMLALYYGFWFWQFGLYSSFGGYSGPLAPAAGLCASVTWFLYSRQPRRSSNVT